MGSQRLSLSHTGALLAAILLLQHASTTTLIANDIYTMTLNMDGSSAPPGDTIDVTILLFPEVRDAILEVRAYSFAPNRKEAPLPIQASGESNSDEDHRFRIQIPLRKSSKSINPYQRRDTDPPIRDTTILRFDPQIVIPYNDLMLSVGTYLIGYELRLITDGTLSEIRPTELTQLAVTDRTRTTMSQTESRKVQSQIHRSRIAYYLKGGQLIEQAISEVDIISRPVNETRVVGVKIPGEFIRSKAGGNAILSRMAPSRIFVPKKSRTIHFATNRDVVDPKGDVDRRFGNNIAPAIDKMAYGSCVVSIPIDKHHKGNIESPGRNWWYFGLTN